MKHCSHCNAGFFATDWRCPECGYSPKNDNGFVLLAPDIAESSEGFRPDTFEKIAKLEAQNFWFKSRNELIIWALKKHLPKIQRYMEVGCGTGYVLAGVAQAYPEAKLVGSEIFSVGLPYAASRVTKAEFIQMDARQIPYVEEFDAIGAFDVLEHIEEDALVLAAILRALRPGGGVAITVPQHPWLWSAADDHACHVRRYKIGELRRKVLRAGFQIEFETSFVSLLLPAMLASRLSKRGKNIQEGAISELSLPPWLNRVFELVMTLERFLILNGLRFKLGGSRFLIATKES